MQRKTEEKDGCMMRAAECLKVCKEEKNRELIGEEDDDGLHNCFNSHDYEEYRSEWRCK